MKKIVIKISSNLLNPDNNVDLIENLANSIASLKKDGNQIIVVTSGAVMHGVKKLGLTKKPKQLPLLQSCASIGQIDLMTRYQHLFQRHNLIPAQILVSNEDFNIRDRYLNLRNMVSELLNIGVLPVFNENDSVNTKELKFGDNDQLSSLVTLMMDFDILIILTDVDGFYDSNPKTNPNAKLISEIKKVDDMILSLAQDSVTEFTTGGMKRKLEASGRVAKAGVQVFIGNGYKVDIKKIVLGEELGTYIRASESNIDAKKRWLGFTPSEKGQIFVDNGAYVALTERHSSLLASGIVSINGEFKKGSLVSIFGKNIKIAQGLTNYSSKEIELIKGKRSSEFEKYIKNSDYEEVIHKNNLYLLK